MDNNEKKTFSELDKLKMQAADLINELENFGNALDTYEANTGKSVNDIKGFCEGYPFEKEYGEMLNKIWDWIDSWDN